MTVELLTVLDIAKLLQVSERTVWSMLKRGEIRRTLIGRSVRVRPQDLQEYVDRTAILSRPVGPVPPDALDDLPHIYTTGGKAPPRPPLVNRRRTASSAIASTARGTPRGNFSP
ncbi:MAG: helix-turn-helix domain-containing protein [candidate division NC10 bacterium]|nr:helix-turn-helix domain-containing protein [candidate division NC10 bacterium]